MLNSLWYRRCLQTVPALVSTTAMNIRASLKLKEIPHRVLQVRKKRAVLPKSRTALISAPLNSKLKELSIKKLLDDKVVISYDSFDKLVPLVKRKGDFELMLDILSSNFEKGAFLVHVSMKFSEAIITLGSKMQFVELLVAAILQRMKYGIQVTAESVKMLLNANLGLVRHLIKREKIAKNKEEVDAVLAEQDKAFLRSLQIALIAQDHFVPFSDTMEKLVIQTLLLKPKRNSEYLDQISGGAAGIRKSQKACSTIKETKAE